MGSDLRRYIQDLYQEYLPLLRDLLVGEELCRCQHMHKVRIDHSRLPLIQRFELSVVHNMNSVLVFYDLMLSEL